MRRFSILTISLLYLLAIIPVKSFGINTKDTRMLAQPAISANHVAFIYAEDLWIANSDGSLPRRLTVDEGIESDPYFSPDGTLIAFTAQYDGNTDVYIIPAKGGVPTRLTWHPGNDIVKGFTPDGSNVLFASQRALFTNRYMQFFLVPVKGGYPTQLQIPNGWTASYSPDGQKMAYTPLGPSYLQWKNYRGGMISNIWIYTFSDHSVVKIPQPEEGCNDTDPMWIGGTIYFNSDRNGEFNLFSFDVTTGDIKQLTSFVDFPVIKASCGNGKIILEQGGYLHTYDIDSSLTSKCLNYDQDLYRETHISGELIFHQQVQGLLSISEVTLLLFPQRKATQETLL